MFHRSSTISVCLLLLAHVSRGADRLEDKIKAVIEAPEYKQAHWGILVVDALTGKTIYELNADQIFTPASTTKLFSCATALCVLGPDHRCETPVYAFGTRKNGVLSGDLVLVASGDLMMGGRTGKDGKALFANSDHIYASGSTSPAQLPDANPLAGLDDLAAQIAKSGIREVRGEVLIDDRLFERASGSGSGPSIVTPIVVNDNIVDVLITPGAKVGDPATVRIRPETAFVQYDVDVITAPAGRAPALSVNNAGVGRFSVRGQIAWDSKPLLRIHSVDDPAAFARALFIEALRRQGVRVQASVFRPEHVELPSPKEYVAESRVALLRSAPLSETVKVTLKVSHNLYASTLPVLVALKNGGRSLETGLRHQGRFLKELGVATNTISFAGGAGGATADAITPRAAIQLLDAMGKRPEATVFFEALPVLGVDGTLADVVPKESPARGKVAAKTGTLGYHDAMNNRTLLRSKALAGVMETNRGTRLYIAMFVNNVPLPPLVTPTREGKVLGKLCEIVHLHGP